MREIKFRAWDKENSVLFVPDRLDWSEGVLVGVSVFNGHDWQGIHIEDIKLMQYTGLKDKNGKEIYEGDVLEGHSDGYVRVTWRNAAWECDFDDEGNISLAELCIWFGNQATVIGNIYENPELIEK